MEQEQLWHDSLEDALKSIVEACGGPKKVGSALWPSKKITDAARQLNHCLDAERPEKLSLDEVLLIARMGKDVGVHTFMAFLSDELGYTKPQPVSPDDERVQLQQEFQKSVRIQQQLVERMEKLAGTSLKAVS